MIIANMLTLFGGNAAIIYLNMLAVFKRRRYGLIWFGLLNPLYWLLHSAAAIRALWQLLAGRPFFWEKTHHGLTRVSEDPTATASAEGPSVARRNSRPAPTLDLQHENVLAEGADKKAERALR